MDSRSERAYAVLVACAIGDAAGLPTRGMSPDEIESTYGPPPTWRDRDVVHPTKPGVPEGTVSEVTHEILAAASVLLGDEAGATIRECADAAPMGWRQLVRAIPVGIATSTADPEAFSRAVWEACGGECLTRQEFQAAALLAAGVSLQVDGAQERLSTRYNRLWEALHLVESGARRRGGNPPGDEHRHAGGNDAHADPDRAIRLLPRTHAHGPAVFRTEHVPCTLALALRDHADRRRHQPHERDRRRSLRRGEGPSRLTARLVDAGRGG